MYLPNKAFDLFNISRAVVDDLRVANASLTSERDALKSELATTKANFAWMTTRVNVLEMERATLLEKAYGVKTIVPEIVRTRAGVSPPTMADLFEDMGDTAAKVMGLPVYEN